MGRAVAWFVGLALLVPAGLSQPCVASAEQVLASHPAEVVERLREKGLVVEPSEGEETGGRTIGALVLFEPAPNRVLDLLSQTERQLEYLPNLRDIERVATFENGNIDEHRLRILFIGIQYGVRHEWDTSRLRMWWALDPDRENDVRHIEGFWQLHPFEGGTLAEYGTRVDIGPLVPSGVQQMLTRKNLPEALQRTREWIDENGRD